MKSRRGKNNFLFSLAEHFEFCRTFLIAFSGALLVGVLIGCFSFIKFNKIFDLGATSILDSNTFFVKVNFFSFALRNFLKFLFCLALIFVFSLNVYLMPFSFFTVGYCGYLLGADLVVMVVVLGFTGLICMIFLYLPIQICIHFLVVNFASKCQKCCCDNFKYGKLCCSKNSQIPEILSFALLIFALIFVLLLIEGIILPTSVKNILLEI